MWNSILAGIVFDHHSIESLRRELSRNLSLAQACGFKIFHGDTVARSSDKWEKLYNKRSAVERVNSRIDNMFGFED